jgi:hypothetical protein
VRLRPAPFLAPLLLLASLAWAAGPAKPSPSPSPHAVAVPPAAGEGPVIVFLVDNSASLPPLDPQEQRVAALEKVFGFLKGQRYRLVLFGGRREIFVDDPSKYANNGQWTDFYFAFEAARQLMVGYPEGTEFRLVLLTDGLMDPDPKDWADMSVPPGADLKDHVRTRLLERIRDLKAPLYVILVGKLPPDGDAGDREHSPPLVMEMVQAANGDLAAPRAQKMASFLKDDGKLLKKFIYRVEPHEGLAKIEPVVRRIVAPDNPRQELQIVSAVIVPLVLFILMLVGVLVRSFPGPGDAELLDLRTDAPLHVATDKLHKLETGGWGTTGLTQVSDAKEATATFQYQTPSLDLDGKGLDLEPLDAVGLRLMALDPDEMRHALEEMGGSGTKEEKIYALNLEYVARNADAAEAERVLTTPAAERRKIPAVDFLRAKAHLSGNAELRRQLSDARVTMIGYGRNADRKDLFPGTRVRIGPYGFAVRDVSRGGRKDIRVVLLYERIPSLLGLKNWLPQGLQRIVRFRRSSHRLVN